MAFRHDVILGAKAIGYQDEVLAEVMRHSRLAVRSPHRAGKTALLAWLVHWFILTKESDVKVPTTASAWRQLSKYLWPEIHKWAKRIDWERVGRAPYERWELLDLSLKLKEQDKEAFAVACDDPATIEGAHARHLLYIFDEAKTIPPKTWDAAEGAFAGGQAQAIAMSTPGPPAGRFYDIHARKLGYEDWWVRHITLDEAVEAGMVSPHWAEERADQWGENSAVYRQRVLGEFAEDEERAVIPLYLVEAANEKWRLWDEAGRPEPGGRRVLGVDVAAGGRSKACIAEREGDVIVSIRKWGGADPMETAGKVAAALGGGRAQVDVIGVGAGTVARLRELGLEVEGVNFGAGTSAADRSGEVKMANVRAAAWWGLRERLEDGEALLPLDDELTGDLVTPRYGYSSSGKLQVESKEEVVRRLGRSPDVGDAVVLAFWEVWPREQVPLEAPRGESRWTKHEGRSRWKR